MADTKTPPQWHLDILDRVKTNRNTSSRRSPELAIAICTALRTGATRKDASLAMGVSPNTLWRWMNDDDAMERAVLESESAAATIMAARVYEAANAGTWQAAAWWLERRRHEDFGKRDRMDVSVETRELAESIAKDRGLDPAALLARAEEIVEVHQEMKRREAE